MDEGLPGRSCFALWNEKVIGSTAQVYTFLKHWLGQKLPYMMIQEQGLHTVLFTFCMIRCFGDHVFYFQVGIMSEQHVCTHQLHMGTGLFVHASLCLLPYRTGSTVLRQHGRNLYILCVLRERET